MSVAGFRKASHAAAIVGMGGLTALHLWPLPKHIGDGVPGGQEDSLMAVWELWWMRQALFERPQNPFFAPILHWPKGAELYWHTLAPAKTAWGVLLLGFMRPETAYGALLAATFVVTGYTTWLLLRHLLMRGGFAESIAAAAAFAGACAFVFSRYNLVHANDHLDLVSLEGIPLYLLFFFRWLESGRRCDLAFLSLAALYTALCNYYYLLYLALFSAAWLLADRWRRGPLLSPAALADPALRRGAAGALAALACCSALLGALVVHAFPAPLSIWHGDTDFYTDLYGFFLPDRLSHWFPKLAPEWQAIVLGMPGNPYENGYFLGLATPALAALGLRAGVRDGWRWAAIGGAFALLSMGMTLSVKGRTDLPAFWPLALLTLTLLCVPALRARPIGRDILVFLAASTAIVWLSPVVLNGAEYLVRVPMPYALFMKFFPFFSRGGMAVRFELLTTLSLAVLVASAAARVGAAAARKSGAAALGAGAAILVASVPNAEYLGQPMPMSGPPARSAIFDAIRAEPESVAVFVDGTILSQYDQIQHGHPVSYARLSRLPVREYDLLRQRLYRMLHEKVDLLQPIPAEEAAEMRAFLAANGFKYFVTHADDEPLRQMVTEALHGERVYQDDYVTAYRFEP